MRTIIPSSMITRNIINASSSTINKFKSTTTTTTTATNKTSTIMINHNLINNQHHLGLGLASSCVQQNNNIINNNNNSRSNSITKGGFNSHHSSNMSLNTTSGNTIYGDSNGNDAVVDIIRNKNNSCNAAIRITENPLPETVAC